MPLTCPAAWCAADGSRFLFSVLGAWLSALGYQNSLLLFLCLRSAPGSLSAHRLASTLGVQATERSRASSRRWQIQYSVHCLRIYRWVVVSGVLYLYSGLSLDAHKFALLAYSGVFDIYVLLWSLTVVRQERHDGRRTWSRAFAEHLQSQCPSGTERGKSEISLASLSAAPPPLVETDASQ